MKTKGIGLEAQIPSKKCSDKNCPFHGNITVRGRVFKGTVISDRMTKTITAEWTRRAFVPKYERYENRRSKIKAHNPECIDAKKGDMVLISETKPISKTKHFVVVEILGRESKKQAVKSELLQEGVVPEKQKPASPDEEIDKDKYDKKKKQEIEQE
jgi:small subunit ribosomal protein S17